MVKQNTSIFIKTGRLLFFLFSGLFSLSVVIQIFFAGLPIFVNPTHWMQHINFIHLFGFSLPVLLLILAIIGRLPQWAHLYAFGLMLGVFSMYFTANFTDINRVVGAFHPVIAFILLFISFLLVKKTTKFIFSKRMDD